MNYIPLNIKTNYSLLESLIDINKLIDFALNNNIKTLSILDNNMFGVMEFYTLCKKNDIKPIIGLNIKFNELDVYLYAKDYIGYQNLCKISSNDINIDLLKENCNSLICIIPYESKELINELNFYEDIFVSYKNNLEREKIKGFKKIYINEIKCISKDDTKYLKYLSMIKDNVKINTENDYNFDNNYFELNIDSKFESDSINYKIINNMINIDIKKDTSLLPKFNSSSDFNSSLYLSSLSMKGLNKRFNNNVKKEYIDRLNYELSIINKMGFNDYFLIVYDYVKFAKKNDILVGPGRGSAAGSLVSYSLGITNVDPIKYNLYFERFLNPERVTMPDIDIDFESDKREKVINYVKEKYGSDKVCNIITFNTLKAKQILRDVSRIFDIEIDDFIKLFDSKKTLIENKNSNIIIKEKLEKDTLLSRIFDISLHLEGLKRHTSINAAGVVISSKTLDNYIPVFKQNDMLVSGFTNNYLEGLGFLKMDFLALDNLVLIHKLMNEVNISNLNDIPLDDKKTFDLFNRGDTDGIFQFESIGIRNVLKKFNVNNFLDIANLLALYRPGPIDNIDSFIRRKTNQEEITYLHEDLKEILSSTYGIIVYQEQIINILIKFASFSKSEADTLRRAMSKKNKDVMNIYYQKFIDGSLKNGYDLEISKKIYNLIYKFSDYGFNKAHSVSYALISYYLAYLKANNLLYFLTHLLSTSDKYKIKEYISIAKTNNIKIRKPDINKSTNEFIVNNNEILFPINSVLNLPQTVSSGIIKERENGLYSDFYNFVRRNRKILNKESLTLLINSGLFDSFKFNHKTLINNTLDALNYADLAYDLDESLVEKPEMVIYDEYDKEEMLEIELNTFGFYFTNHPVSFKRDNNITTKNIKEYFNKEIIIYLMIDRKKEILTKNNEQMAFYNASDEFSSIELVSFPKVYETSYEINRKDLVKIKGKVERRFDKYQIVINNIKKV